MSLAEPRADSANVFAHSRRQRILRLLAERPEIGQSLIALQHATGYRAAPLLKHLRIMERTGLIARDPQGHNVAGGLTPGLRVVATSGAAHQAHVA